ncbi:MAG TPA: type VII secretion target [Pseudonocardiaceae bacterium]
MTGAGKFGVDTDQLHTHAAAVGDLAGQLSSVVGGQPGGLSDNALGSFVQFLTGGLQDAMNRTTQSIGAAASGVDNVSLRISQTAHGYQNTDTTGAGRLDAVQLPTEESR